MNRHTDDLPSKPWRPSCPLTLVLGALLASLPSMAAGLPEVSVSGFGTLGYAVSNQPFGYQRFIDDKGTFKRDSVAGLQVDASHGSGFGATLQVKAAPATSNDTQYDATVSWAFVSYRPNNDWLFRAGKQRIPLYLYSETYDVGATYDFARLPTEMYSLTPSNDFTGVSLGRNWKALDGDLSVDGYWGESKNTFRFWFRDGLPPVLGQGASFLGLDFKGVGLVISYKARDQLFRMSIIRASIRERNRQGGGFPASFPFVALAPGIGYYQVDPSIPGPGVGTVDKVVNTTVTLGADFLLPADLRFVGELAHSMVSQSDYAPQGTRGYASVLRQTGRWTPYLTYAFMRSPDDSLRSHNEINNNTVPAFVPSAALLNASQRAGADQVLVFDQSSWMVGASYAFSATSKVKAEYMRSRIEAVSILVDAPPGSNIRHQSINVFSLSYSVVF